MLKLLHVKITDEEYETCAVHVVAVRTAFHWGIFVTYETGVWGESSFEFGDVDELPDRKEERPAWWKNKALEVFSDVDKGCDSLFGVQPHEEHAHETWNYFQDKFATCMFTEDKWTVLHDGV